MDCCKKTIRSEIEKKDITIRLNKVIGQLNGIKEMLENDRYCYDIIIQLKAANKAIKNVENIMLKKHINSCVKDAILNNDLEILNEMETLIDLK